MRIIAKFLDKLELLHFSETIVENYATIQFVQKLVLTQSWGNIAPIQSMIHKLDQYEFFNYMYSYKTFEKLYQFNFIFEKCTNIKLIF